MGSSDRRMFLQAAGATLALPLVGGEVPFARELKEDNVGPQLLRELVTTIKRAEGKARGEHLRAAASSLRLLQVHYLKVWPAADRALAKALADKGGATNLAAADASDTRRRNAMRNELRKFGLDDHRHVVDVVGLSEGLESLRSLGHASAISRLAVGLEQLAAAVDARPPVQLVARQQNSEICSQLFWNIVVADAACFAASLTPGAQLPAISICALAYWLHMMYSLNGC
jgi:hypothetical protein